MDAPLSSPNEIESIVDAAYMQSVDTRLDSYDAYIDYQLHEAQRAIPFFAKYFQVQGARILEVGTGRGGKGIAYALQGMQVTALDVNLDSLKLAAEAAQKRSANIRLLASDGAHLPFPSDYFNAVLIDSVIEHVHDPRGVLQECKRVLKPGGIIFVIFPPFYGPLSGHIDDFIMIPWFHLLPQGLVQKALFAFNKPRGILTPHDTFEVFLSLNKLTIWQFRRMVKQVGLKYAYLRIRPFLTHPGNRLLAGLVAAVDANSRLERLRQVFARARHEFDLGTVLLFALLVIITPLVFIPILQEFSAGACKAVLRKE